MEVTPVTWVVAVTGLVLVVPLGTLQFVAVIKPRTEWTIKNVYGGSPHATEPTACFACNQGHAWAADLLIWAPLQIAGSIGMLLGQKWGFLLGPGRVGPVLVHRDHDLHLGPRPRETA